MLSTMKLNQTKSQSQYLKNRNPAKHKLLIRDLIVLFADLFTYIKKHFLWLAIKVIFFKSISFRVYDLDLQWTAPEMLFSSKIIFL